MNSEEALFELYKQIKTHRRTSKKIIENKQQYERICKDLEVLEILKSLILYDEGEIDRHNFIKLSATTFDDDNINKIKEWLENE